MFAIKESNKSRFDIYGVRNSVLIISHTVYYLLGIVACTCFQTTFLEIAVYMVTSKYSVRERVMFM